MRDNQPRKLIIMN